ncbi:hypothetical protein GCM10020000_55330 [Streptomyces olivoverticillatus]
MLDLAVAVLEDKDPESLWHLIAAHLLGAFDCSTVIFAGLQASNPAGQAEGWAPESLGPAVDDIVRRRVLQQHPLVSYLTAGERSPVTMNRIADSWRNTACFSEARAEYGTTQQLGLPLPTGGNLMRAVSLGRKGADFSAHDLAFATRIQPLLVAMDNHIRELRRLHAAAARTSGLLSVSDHGLTPREQTVLNLLSEGLTTAAIGHRLTISPHTVNRHLEKIYRKLGTNNRVATVTLAREAGLVR